jgi:D-lactate dehydrogenase (cytochrome)
MLLIYVMPSSSIRARAAKGAIKANAGNHVQRDPDVLAGFLEDAAHFPGGCADGLVAATCEADVANLLHGSLPVLAVGAQSSLTGGATPMGEVLLTTSRLNRIFSISTASVHVEAGVTLTDLDAALRNAGRYYPPTPTFMGAFVGGTIATNAAGAATFKYGTTREWVLGVTVVLPSGEVLDIERGQITADADGHFDIHSTAGATTRIAIPTYRLPQVAKLAAGYFAAPQMDLIDLFIGSEGTLGVITEATLRVLPVRPAMCLALVPFAARLSALAFARQLRGLARDTWRTKDPNGIDVSAIEHMDARCLELLREDGIDIANSVTIPDGSEIALLITLELPPTTTPEQAFDEIGSARESGGRDGPLRRFCRLLDAAGVLDDVEVAVPGDLARANQLLAVREAVPAAVNQRVGLAKRAVDARIEKTAADMIVPFDRLEELLTIYETGFGSRGLDAAIWGHLSDGNLHPNVIPRSYDDVKAGKAAILEFGREAIRLGGAPLAEHGVGRNPVKQQLLELLYGKKGVDEMRAIKAAIDPEWKLAPGVLFTKR